MLMHALLLAAALAAAAAPKDQPIVPLGVLAPAPAKPETRLEPPERYRMVLGSEAGRYNDWEKRDITRFYGVVFNVNVAKVHGKPKDQWASVVRLNLMGAGDDKTRPVLAFVLQYDRKTHKPLPYYTRSDSDKTYGFQADLPADKPIEVRVVAMRPGKLIVGFDANRFEIDLPFEVTGISVVASGLDAAIEPFELLRRQP